MCPKLDSKKRCDLILGIVVDQYIKTVQPVGSAYVAKNYDLGVSPATIRSVLAELETDDFLTHPHTSAGRVPTQKGYRYYVDFLMHEIRLLEEEKERLQKEHQQSVDQLEALLEKTSEAVSDITQCTSIISLDGSNKIIYRGTSNIVNYPDALDLAEMRSILRTLEKQELILDLINRDLQKKTQVYIGHEMALKEMESCSMAVSKFEGANGVRGRIAVLGPTRMDYQRVVSALDYVSDLFKESY